MRTHRLVGLAASSLLALHLSAGLVHAQPRTAETIVTEVQTLEQPKIAAEDRENEAAVAKYREDMAKYSAKRAELAWELYQADPANGELKTLLPQRWGFLNQNKKTDQVLTETAAIIKDRKGTPVAATAAYSYAGAIGTKHGLSSAEYLKAADDFRTLDPQNDRGASLYMQYAQEIARKDPKGAIKHYKKVAEYYPDARSGKMALGKVRQVEGVGKPFELSFTEAVSGKPMTMKDLRGKVVVIDFWATWCGPCVGEMPHMKELYAQYKDHGVEFIGISLDHPEDKGGLTKLKDFVAQNDIKWPQYYQGNYWDSEFSVSWGINSIPALFVVDKKGNLHTTEGRGKLEELLPKLLGAS
jgi:thiol-disulfide isomerase/thioredoxin